MYITDTIEQAIASLSEALEEDDSGVLRSKIMEAIVKLREIRAETSKKDEV